MDQELLSQIFSALEIELINRTHTSTVGISNRLVWSASKQGQYTVSSGYQMAKICDAKAKGDEGTSSRSTDAEKNL